MKGIFSIIRFFLGLGVTLVLIMACLFVDARFIEPKLLTTDKISIKTHQLASENKLKIVQFSDTHLGAYYLASDLQKLVDKINSMAPDLIIFTGDLIDDNKTFDDEEGATKVLAQLQSKYGKYAVIGNHDHGGNGTKRYKRIMENSGFHLLVNSYEMLTLEDGSKISIVGIDDVSLGRPAISETLKQVPQNSYKIFLSHAPDIAEEAEKNGADLQLSGHTHGGQVRLPFIGAPFTPPYGEMYVKGLYEVGESKMPVYVNSGIGGSQLPYRFLNPPQLSVITIEKLTQSAK